MSGTPSIANPALPGLDGLRELVGRWSGSCAYIIPIDDPQGRSLGNNGDELMHAVFRRILDRFEIVMTENPAKADFLIVPPNGALLEIYRFPSYLREDLKRLPDIPLIIFPSSAFFPSVDPTFMFEGRSASTLWIFREARSKELISTQWGARLAQFGVTLALDHDVVASGHEFVPAILNGSKAPNPALVGARTLVAARIDMETSRVLPTSTQGTVTLSRRGAVLLKRRFNSAVGILPYGRARTLLVRRLRAKKLRDAGRALVESLPRRYQEEMAIAHGPCRMVDLSGRPYATFDEYCEAIRSSDLIITNRLHVALPAAIVGKRVIIVEAGYHKLEGVYRQSLARAENVELVVAR